MRGPHPVKKKALYETMTDFARAPMGAQRQPTAWQRPAAACEAGFSALTHAEPGWRKKSPVNWLIFLFRRVPPPLLKGSPPLRIPARGVEAREGVSPTADHFRSGTFAALDPSLDSLWLSALPVPARPPQPWRRRKARERSDSRQHGSVPQPPRRTRPRRDQWHGKREKSVHV